MSSEVFYGLELLPVFLVVFLVILYEDESDAAPLSTGRPAPSQEDAGAAAVAPVKQSGIISLTLILVIVIAVAGIAAIAAFKMWRGEVEDHAKTAGQYAVFKEETKRLGEKAEAEKIMVLAEQKRISDESSKLLEDRFADLSTRYAGLRGKPDPRRRDVPRLSEAAAAIPTCPGPETTDVAGLLDRLESGILGILEKGDREIAKYMELWQWAKRQEAVK